jgi:MoaA/NifB/PqqE/SkfB family radical SAM enzyme
MDIYYFRSMTKKNSIMDKVVETLKADPDYPIDAEYPKNIMIEVTNACNLKCTMCYHKHMKRKIGFMEEKLYRKIIKEAKELNIENVGLYTTGESFLHPKIFEFIRIAKEDGIKYVYITTNGQTLDKEDIKENVVFFVTFTVLFACVNYFDVVNLFQK